MSLEEAIQENTAALRELLDIWKKANGGVQAAAGQARAGAAKQATQAPAQPGVTRESVKAQLLKVIREKGEAVAAEALGKHKAVKLSQVPDGKLADLSDELSALA